jgi:hypothetical protein
VTGNTARQRLTEPDGKLSLYGGKRGGAHCPAGPDEASLRRLTVSNLCITRQICGWTAPWMPNRHVCCSPQPGLEGPVSQESEGSSRDPASRQQWLVDAAAAEGRRPGSTSPQEVSRRAPRAYAESNVDPDIRPSRFVGWPLSLVQSENRALGVTYDLFRD